MPSSLRAGGGSDSTAASVTPSPTARISKADLIKRGDAICRKTDQIHDEAIAAYTEQHGEVPPNGEEAQVGSILTGFEKASRWVEQKPSVLLGSEVAKFAKPETCAVEDAFKVRATSH